MQLFKRQRLSGSVRCTVGSILRTRTMGRSDRVGDSLICPGRKTGCQSEQQSDAAAFAQRAAARPAATETATPSAAPRTRTRSSSFDVRENGDGGSDDEAEAATAAKKPVLEATRVSRRNRRGRGFRGGTGLPWRSAGGATTPFHHELYHGETAN